MNRNVIDIEQRLMLVVLVMELAGVKIDIKVLKNVESRLKSLQHSTQSDITKIAGEEFNPNSGEQLSRLLFEELGLIPMVKKKSKKGYYSVDKQHLVKIKEQHGIVIVILKYRKIQSLLKFCNQLNQIHPRTGRLHANFNQIGTATGRFSSSKPNLQNIPNKEVKDNESDELIILEATFRKLFVPKTGYYFIGADYSQIELRVTAEFSQDPYLLKAYNEDFDIHQLVASEIYNLPFSEVTKEQRSVAKSINFGLIYGKTARGLAGDLATITGNPHTVEQAEQMMNDYFARFGKVKACLDGLINFADHFGYSKTLWGRRRSIPELSSNDLKIREKGKRLAMNSPIQGSAADIIKMAMISCQKAITENELNSKLILQVHDELLFEVPENELEIMKALVQHEMENVVNLSVPLKVDMKVGKNWGEVH